MHSGRALFDHSHSFSDRALTESPLTVMLWRSLVSTPLEWWSNSNNTIIKSFCCAPKTFHLRGEWKFLISTFTLLLVSVSFILERLGIPETEPFRSKSLSMEHIPIDCTVSDVLWSKLRFCGAVLRNHDTERSNSLLERSICTGKACGQSRLQWDVCTKWDVRTLSVTLRTGTSPTSNTPGPTMIFPWFGIFDQKIVESTQLKESTTKIQRFQWNLCFYR